MTDEAQTLAMRWGVPLAIAMLAVVARYLVTAPKPTLWALVRGMVVGVFVGALTNLYLADIPAISDGTRGALVGLAAILAEDLVIVILAGGRKLRSNPAGVWDFLLSIIRRRIP